MKTSFQRSAFHASASQLPATGQRLAIVSSVLALGLLAGCSSIGDIMQGERVDYKSSGAKAPSLEVPPDLTQLNRESRYVVPGTAVTASSY